MIHIITGQDEQGLCSLCAKGHSGYAAQGSDIVCAAASALMITCANALEAVAGVKPLVCDEPGTPLLRITLPEGLNPGQRHDAGIIMESALLGLKSVAESEPKYLQIK